MSLVEGCWSFDWLKVESTSLVLESAQSGRFLTEGGRERDRERRVGEREKKEIARERQRDT